jgi:predicted ABC-type sugar transport system permease subunit
MSYLVPFLMFAIVNIASPVAASGTRVPSTTEGSASMTPLMLGDGGLAQYWWIVLVAVIVLAALWYFMRHRTRRVREGTAS